MQGVDRMDVHILRLIQENASRSTADIAEQVGLSQNACWRRVRLLEEHGYIRKRVALLDAKKLGVGMTVFVTVRAAEHTDEWLREFAAIVDQLPEVMEFYRMTGDIDYLIKLQVADIDAYDRVYKTLIRSIRLTDLSGSFAMEAIKQTTAIPLPTFD